MATATTQGSSNTRSTTSPTPPSSTTTTSSSPSSSSAATGTVEPDVLVVEPFFCGSHKQLVDCLVKDDVIRPRVHLVTMSGKKWHWRARVSALHLTTAIPVDHHFRVIFSSSTLNLAELVALRPDLAGLHKVLYFHENQLHYPVRKHRDRDFQYGYNQILSCLVADSVLFNSAFNKESFLTSIASFLKLMPDYRPKGLADSLRPKCSVVPFPVQFPTHVPHTPTPHHVPHAANHATQPTKNVPVKRAPSPQLTTITPPSTVQVKSTQTSTSTTVDFPYGAGSHKPDTTTAPVVDMQVEQEGDEDHKGLVTCLGSGSSRVDSSCCGGDAGTTQSSHADHKPPQSGSVCERTDMAAEKPQAKIGRLDSELSMYHDGDGGGPCLNFQTEGAVDDDGGDFRSPQKKLVPSVVSGPCGGCVKRSFSHSVHQPGEGGVIPDTGIKPSTPACKDKDTEGCLHIVWPHRWEHDKDPETFFHTLFKLQENNLPFVVSVLGETFTDVPDIFSEAERRLKGRVVSWGYQAERSDYFRILQQADVVVSTSKHEFFGVAMLEAVYLGCYPLCPKALVYPELYPDECLYSTANQLYKRLRSFCLHPKLPRQKRPQMDLQRFSWETLRPVFLSKLQIHC